MKLIRWTLFVVTTIACIPLMPLIALTVYVMRPTRSRVEMVTTITRDGEP